MGELIDRPPQPAELGSEQVEVRGPRLGRRQTLGRLDRGLPAGGSRRAHAQRLAGHGHDFQVERHLAIRRPFKRPTQAAGQLGVVGLPDLLADLELAAGRSPRDQTGARPGR